MGTSEILNIVLVVVGIIAIVALIWLIVELVATVRKTREAVDSMHKQLEPTLANMEEITEACKPLVAKADPLVDRVTLTVDAVNLEVMRLDKILEDVGDITTTATSAVNAVDAVANTPLNLITSASARLRDAFKPKAASDESVALGEAKAAAAPAASAAAAGEADGPADSGEEAKAAKAPVSEYYTISQTPVEAADRAGSGE